ncbi:hypothetical protein BH11ACT6_BH11ACT6_53480 [soil metagenome]
MSERVLADIADPAERLAFIREGLANGLARSAPSPVPKTVVAAVSAPAKPRATVGQKPMVAVKPKAPPEIPMNVAVHEAGHAVVSVLVGAEVDVAEAFPEGLALTNAAGYCRFEPFNPAVSQQEYLIIAAGPAAEAVSLHSASVTAQQMNAVAQRGVDLSWSDGHKLRQYALTAGAIFSDPLSEVKPLVLRVWPAIAKLAVVLQDEGKIHHEQVTAALGLSKDRAAHGFELASIRAGLRGVPDPLGPRR